MHVPKTAAKTRNLILPITPPPVRTEPVLAGNLDRWVYLEVRIDFNPEIRPSGVRAGSHVCVKLPAIPKVQVCGRARAVVHIVRSKESIVACLVIPLALPG